MNVSSKILAIVTVLMLGITSGLKAEVSVPAVISEHMVLQQQAEVPIWGWADAGETVTVVFANQIVNTKTDDKGAWKVLLKDLQAGTAGTLSIQGKSNKITVEDVLVGEVWLGSGQSNMAMTVSGSKGYQQELTQADFPQIRMFKEESGASDVAESKGKGKWLICSAETVGKFSATLYFFGREIHQTMKVPVGLINSSVGGTPIESWIDPQAQKSSAELEPFFTAIKKATPVIDPAQEQANYEKQLEVWKKAVIQAKAAGKTSPRKPQDPAQTRASKGKVGGLYLGKIAPLVPYRIKGAIWYQGEANSTPDKAKFYQHQLPLLVKDWRAKWGYDFPFAWAQLPNFKGEGRDWPLVREAMLKSLSVPDTGMGINIDIGETNDIHPKNKQEVGRRLSLWALGTVYKVQVPATSGPLPAGHEIKGNEVVLKFTHAKGLNVEADLLKGFVLAGDDKVWHPADAKIVGETVIVSSSLVTKPKAVRYLWENDPQVKFIRNSAGLPMTPFRTDDWE